LRVLADNLAVFAVVIVGRRYTAQANIGCGLEVGVLYARGDSNLLGVRIVDVDIATLGNRRYEITSLFISWVERRIEICRTYMRERSDNPILRAFRHVALSVRFRFLAILPAGVFFRASNFKVRTSAVVQARLLNPFFTI